MEIILPILGLGGLYVLSNRNRETFISEEVLSPPIVKNYPIASPVTKNNDINYYGHPNQVTDKYFKPRDDVSSQYIVDMAERKIPITEFTSNNMVPYYKSEKNMNDTSSISETQLDTLVGSGSTYIHKSETAPLFKPQENIQWANGSPNQSDFYQSRVNPGAKASNVLPFQSEMVGPGINKGFTTSGSGGYNSGMEAREVWKDKTVNELRVLTNPKLSYELNGHEGPAEGRVKNVGKEGIVEKHLPDKFFINSPERYFTTTGIEKGPTLRAIEPTPTIHRATTSREYSGVAGNTGVPEHAQRGVYREDHKQQLKSELLTPAVSVPLNNLDGVSQGYNFPNNNRSVRNHETVGALQGLVSAITAPITDLLRPSRKENVIGAYRIAGNPTGPVPSAPVFNPADRVPTTTKETTTYNPFIMGQRPYDPTGDGGYKVSEHQAVNNQRDTTSISYTGVGQGPVATTSYNSAYNSTIQSNRETVDRMPTGNANFFNTSINQQSNNLRTSTHVPYTSAPVSFNSLTPSMDRIGEMRKPQTYEQQNRMEPSLLEAFKQNPYTHSLHSVA